MDICFERDYCSIQYSPLQEDTEQRRRQTVLEGQNYIMG